MKRSDPSVHSRSLMTSIHFWKSSLSSGNLWTDANLLSSLLEKQSESESLAAKSVEIEPVVVEAVVPVAEKPVEVKPVVVEPVAADPSSRSKTCGSRTS